METYISIDLAGFEKSLNVPYNKTGEIKGIILENEGIVHAFIETGTIIGAWHFSGFYCGSSLPLHIELSVQDNRYNIKSMEYNGNPVSKEYVRFIDYKREIVSRHNSLIDVNLIETSTFFVIGAGTVGSLSIMQLVRMGAYRFNVIDNDTVECSNLSRTAYDYADIGRKKVVAMENRILSVNPHAKIEPVHADVRNLPDSKVLELANKSTVCLIAIDDVMCQIHLSHIISRYIPVVVSTIEDGGNSGEITFITRNSKQFCCVTNINDRLRSAPRGVSGAQALISDIYHVISETVNTMIHLIQDRASRRFPEPLNANENVHVVGRGDAGGVLQSNLRNNGLISGITVDTSRRPSGCRFCGV